MHQGQLLELKEAFVLLDQVRFKPTDTLLPQVYLILLLSLACKAPCIAVHPAMCGLAT